MGARAAGASGKSTPIRTGRELDCAAAGVADARSTLQVSRAARHVPISALRQLRLDDTPQGSIRIDPYGNPIVNVYIRRVERS